MMPFSMFSLMFSVVSLFILGTFAAIVFRSISQWNKNNHSPRLTVPARVISRRTHVTHRNSANGMGGRSTSYYVTFQFESGDRLELRLQGHEFGLMVEGDQGDLTFQGTRFLKFERT